jgi:hypothetical protein
MATEGIETRRGFLSGLLVIAGGGAAVALSGIGCAAPTSKTAEGDALPPAGATEVVALSPGNYYGNVMPDHIAAVRLRASADRAPDFSTSKAYE